MGLGPMAELMVGCFGGVFFVAFCYNATLSGARCCGLKTGHIRSAT